ncbi:MAG: ABC transporter permease [Cellulosilyticaceae bacterium]
MKKRVIVYSVLFIGFQLLKSILLLNYKTDYGVSRIQVVLDDNALAYETIMNKEVYETYYPIRTSYKKGIHIEELSHEGITIIATDFNEQDLEKLQMQEGTFFGKEAGLEGRNLAIISDTMAIKLFGSSKVLGNKIHIQNKVYQISGVYKRYNSLKDYRLDCGQEKIYIPLKSELSKEWNIKEIGIDGTFLETLPDKIDLGKMGIDIDKNIINDQRDWYKKIKSLNQIPLIVVTVMLMYKFLKYLPGLMIQDKTTKEKVLKIGGFLIFFMFLLKLSVINFGIIPHDLPSKNIFDISFYWKALINEWARHNQFVNSSISPFESALYQLREIVYVLNGIQIIVVFRLTFKNT